MQQNIGMPMGYDPAPFWANLYLYSYETEFISNLITTDKIRARHFHATKRFIDDVAPINDGGEFGRSFSDIYPPELELKLESTGNKATFLNLDIEIENGIFRYKLFDKRDEFPFSIVRMPYRQSNMPENIFYATFSGEFLRIGRSTLKVEDFIPKIEELTKRMKTQGASKLKIDRHIKKTIRNHPGSFVQLGLNELELIQKCVT